MQALTPTRPRSRPMPPAPGPRAPPPPPGPPPPAPAPCPVPRAPCPRPRRVPPPLIPALIPRAGTGSGLVMDWQQRRGSLIVSGDTRVIRVWDVERELCSQVGPRPTRTAHRRAATDAPGSYVPRSALGPAHVVRVVHHNDHERSPARRPDHCRLRRWLHPRLRPPPAVQGGVRRAQRPRWWVSTTLTLDPCRTASWTSGVRRMVMALQEHRSWIVGASWQRQGDSEVVTGRSVDDAPRCRRRRSRTHC